MGWLSTPCKRGAHPTRAHNSFFLLPFDLLREPFPLSHLWFSSCFQSLLPTPLSSLLLPSFCKATYSLPGGFNYHTCPSRSCEDMLEDQRRGGVEDEARVKHALTSLPLFLVFANMVLLLKLPNHRFASFFFLFLFFFWNDSMLQWKKRNQIDQTYKPV